MAATRFRIIATVMGLVMAAYAGMSLLSELVVPGKVAFPSSASRIVAPNAEIGSTLATFMSPLLGQGSRSALVLAFQALGSSNKGTPASKALNEDARAEMRRALSWAPYDSRGWLALAMLEAQANPNNPAIADALKMSYFTAPNDADLMPLRLDTATRFSALSDSDLSELARGDVRMILTRQTQQRAALSDAYMQASAEGKTFLEAAVRAIEPDFVPFLRR